MRDSIVQALCLLWLTLALISCSIKVIVLPPSMSGAPSALIRPVLSASAGLDGSWCASAVHLILDSTQTATADKHAKALHLQTYTAQPSRAASQNPGDGVHLVVCVPERSGITLPQQPRAPLSRCASEPPPARRQSSLSLSTPSPPFAAIIHSLPTSAPLTSIAPDLINDVSSTSTSSQIPSRRAWPAPEPTRSCSLCAALANGEPRGKTPR